MKTNFLSAFICVYLRLKIAFVFNFQPLDGAAKPAPGARRFRLPDKR
jgi:hypothetical protein